MTETITGLTGVPDYTRTRFAEKHSDYCLLIPIINEGGRILAELDRAAKAGIPEVCDIILCDGGSTDGSMDPAGLIPRRVNTLLVKTGPGRQGAQLRMGLWEALQRGYKGILTIDGNNKDSIESVPLFIQKLEQGYDLVQGSRFVKGGRAVNTPHHQRLPGLQPRLPDPSGGAALPGRVCRVRAAGLPEHPGHPPGAQSLRGTGGARLPQSRAHPHQDQGDAGQRQPAADPVRRPGGPVRSLTGYPNYKREVLYDLG